MDILLSQHKNFLLLLLKHEVAFILIGGYAVIYHGYERTTADMDIWLMPDNSNRDKFVAALIENGIEQETISVLKNTDFTQTHVMHLGEKPFQIDFLTRVNNVTFDEAWEQKIMLPLKDLSVPVLHFEHLILTKITSNRTKDKLDVEELQKINQFRKEE